MKNRFSLIAAAVLVLAGCAKEANIQNETPSGKTARQITIKAMCDNTKTTEADGHLSWVAAEAIDVVESDSDVISPFTASDPATGTFSGSVTNEPAFAVSPSSVVSNALELGGEILYTITLDNVSAYVPGTTNALMVAGAPEKDNETYVFKFRHAAALIKVPVVNIPVGVSSIKLTMDKNITGVWENLSTVVPVPEIGPCDAGDPSVTLTLAKAISKANTTQNFYFAVPVNTYTSFKVELFAGESRVKAVGKSGLSVALTAGDLLTTPAIEFEKAATPSWVETALGDLEPGDVFVIVASKEGDSWAMSNDNGASAAPAAVAVTVNDGQIESEVDDNLQWNLTVSEGNYSFYPNGETEKWLYCTNSNNGVRVGTNDNKAFVVDNESGYLKHVATSRYLGVYNSQDWRCYTNTTGNTAGQTFAFYKQSMPDSRLDAGMSWSAENAAASILTGNEISFEAPVLTAGFATGITYESTNTEVATIDESGNVGIVAAGEALIKAKFAGDANYKPAVVSYTLTVSDERAAAATPEFSPEAGAVAANTQVSISCATQGATIYYTVDGSEPTAESSVYSEAIVIDAAKTIKAFAVKDGYKPSAVASAAYTIAGAPASGWVATDIASIEAGDVFVIVCHKSTGDYAMSNDNGTGAAPSAVAVEVSGDELSGEIADNLKWNLTVSEDGYIFYPDGDAEKWLYCTAANNGLRVGTNTNSAFVIDNESGYLKSVATSRYLGVYNAQDWRSYTTPTTTNIANQTFTFYKYGESDVREDPGMSWSSDSATASIQTGNQISFEAPVLTPGNATGITYESTNTAVATIDGSGNVSILAAGSTTIKAKFEGNESYKAAVASYTLTVTDDREAVATPVFSPEAGAVAANTEVTISCATQGATIHYTVDGSAPTAESSVYSQAIVIDDVKTIKAIAVKAGYKDSEVAVAAYTISGEAAPGSAEKPFTVSEVQTVMDAGSYDASATYYVKGIISKITTAYNSTYHNTSFDVSEDGLTEGAQFRMYRAAAESAEEYKVGDAVVMYGTLTMYGSVYEFNNGCTKYLQACKPAISPAGCEFSSDSFSVTLASDSFDSIVYTLDGSTPSAENGTVYSSAIVLDATTTVKAVAIKGDICSAVASETYTKAEPSFGASFSSTEAQTSVEVSASATSAKVFVTGNVSWSVATSEGASAAVSEGSGIANFLVSFPANEDTSNGKVYTVTVSTTNNGVNPKSYTLTINQAAADGQGGDEEEEKTYTITWNAQNNSKSVSSYTESWDVTADGLTCTMQNWNNNKNVWNYVKAGRKNNASVATIITAAAIPEKIKTVTITIDALTAAKINSIKLYVSDSTTFGDAEGEFTKATGDQSVVISSPAANKYYKLEFDCASGSSNGLITVSKLVFTNN